MKNAILLILLTFLSCKQSTDYSDSWVSSGQNKYILNDSILMQKLKFCYFGDTVVYNDLPAEFYGPLPKCSNGTYHTFIIDSNYFIVYPETTEWTGSGGGHFFLYKRENSDFKEIDAIWGDLDLQKHELESNIFYYHKRDISTEIYKIYEYEFTIDKEKDKFLILNKTLFEVYNNPF